MSGKTTQAMNDAGYQSFILGNYIFKRDEYFVHVEWPNGGHILPADRFLKALMRDVAWNFFYGIVNFDEVFGTANHYGTVDIFAGSYNASYRDTGKDHSETFDSETARHVFEAMLQDWTNEGFDPFAAPGETGSAFGPKRGSNENAVKRQRVTAKRMTGAADDTPLRNDMNGYGINRQFADVPQDEPEIHAEPGFEHDVHAFNLFAYLSRSDVTWNPSVCSVVKDSLFCPTTEEYMLPVIHGNDRVEWFIQLSDEIHWEVADRDTGEARARVIMKAGDVAAMPADIRHQGMSPKRSMLLVWENADPALPELYASNKLKANPIAF
ncbi:MAG TPA: hypothetical protein VMU41_03515 [Candidatus Binataceae bacterium]|nr:hypothetical protein [Candidatus Binataceae bacterium]